MSLATAISMTATDAISFHYYDNVLSVPNLPSLRASFSAALQYHAAAARKKSLRVNSHFGVCIPALPLLHWHQHLAQRAVMRVKLIKSREQQHTASVWPVGESELSLAEHELFSWMVLMLFSFLFFPLTPPHPPLTGFPCVAQNVLGCLPLNL